MLWLETAKRLLVTSLALLHFALVNTINQFICLFFPKNVYPLSFVYTWESFSDQQVNQPAHTNCHQPFVPQSHSTLKSLYFVSLDIILCSRLCFTIVLINITKLQRLKCLCLPAWGSLAVLLGLLWLLFSHWYPPFKYITVMSGFLV